MHVKKLINNCVDILNIRQDTYILFLIILKFSGQQTFHLIKASELLRVV